MIFGSTRNVPALWPEPEGVTTVSLPVEASAGTKTVIAVAVTVAGVAGTPSKRTLVAPVKALPPIVTFVPTGAAEGVKEATRGSTSSVAALVAVPPAVVTEIGPSVAPPGTVSRSSVRERREKPALVPFTLTEVTPPKPVPSTTTWLLGAAAPGAKPLIVGTARKRARLVAVPPAVTTESLPLVAVSGTVAVIWWSESMLGLVAATPLNLTALTSVKPEPVMVTLAPAAPLPGLKEVSFGSTLKTAALSPVPFGLVTPILPVRAPAGTVARICVGDTIVGVAATPPKVTEVAVPTFLPLIVTSVPTAPAVGLKPETIGIGATSARLWPTPAAIAATLERPLGTPHCPRLFPAPQPHATTVPLLLRARLCVWPAEIAVTPERPAGTLHCPASPSPQPQPTTVPSLFRARLLMSPAAIATTPERPLGTLHCPQLIVPQPQATTVPSFFRARLWTVLAAIAVTPERPLGTSHCPESCPPPQPHATTVPSFFRARLCTLPAAIAVTPERPPGTLH